MKNLKIYKTISALLLAGVTFVTSTVGLSACSNKEDNKIEITLTDVNDDNKKVILDLTIDTDISPVLDYFEIFMDRTMMSKKAAKYLNIWFELIINDTKLL